MKHRERTDEGKYVYNFLLFLIRRAHLTLTHTSWFAHKRDHNFSLTCAHTHYLHGSICSRRPYKYVFFLYFVSHSFLLDTILPNFVSTQPPSSKKAQTKGKVCSTYSHLPTGARSHTPTHLHFTHSHPLTHLLGPSHTHSHSHTCEIHACGYAHSLTCTHARSLSFTRSLTSIQSMAKRVSAWIVMLTR
jgi:hypothetical protein